MPKSPQRVRKVEREILTFKVKYYKDGEWVAQCKEYSGILTGGHTHKKGKKPSRNEVLLMVQDVALVVHNLDVRVHGLPPKPK